MPYVPEISAEFSAPPEFSGDVLEKDLSTGCARTCDVQTSKQILYHCATASLFGSLCGIYYETYWPFFFYWPQDFPSVSVFTGWDFPAVSVVNGRDFPAISAVTVCGIFRRYL
jgi:hypothetical protein